MNFQFGPDVLQESYLPQNFGGDVIAIIQGYIPDHDYQFQDEMIFYESKHIIENKNALFMAMRDALVMRKYKLLGTLGTLQDVKKPTQLEKKLS